MFDDDLDEAAFLAAWDEVDSEAVEILLSALPGINDSTPPPLPDLQRPVARLRAGVAEDRWPFGYFGGQVSLKPLPSDDLHCFSVALLATMQPDIDIDADEDGDWAIEDMATVQSLEHADWLGAVIGLVRAGPGAEASPEALVRYINECPEIDGEVDPDDETILEHAFELMMPLWEALDVVDEERRVTRLGMWALPRMLLDAWTSA